MKEHYHWTEKTTYRVKESICNHTSDKGLISRICKSKLENKNNHPFKKWAKNWSRQLSTEYIQRVNKHIKRCLISLVIRKTEIKSSMQYHFMPTKMAIIFFFFFKENNKYWQRSREMGIPIHFCWECKICSRCGKRVWWFLRNLNIELPCVCACAQLCQALCDPMDCGLPCSSVSTITTWPSNSTSKYKPKRNENTDCSLQRYSP